MKKLFLLLLFYLPTIAQEKDIFSYEEFINNVILEHPIAKSAQLYTKIGTAKLLSTKGNLDPYLTSYWSEKNFTGKDYYNKFQSKLNIPTSLGIQFNGGYTQNNGIYLNPENNTPLNGLWNVGIEIDVLQGLLVNERNTALKNAQIYQSIARNQQQQWLNDLIFNASKAYADWQKYQLNYYAINKYNLLISKYLENTKSTFLNGEKSAIDTLEAYGYFQHSRIKLLQYDQLLTEKKLKLENFLWLQQQPVVLANHLTPETTLILQEQKSLNPVVLDSLPMINEKSLKISQLENEQLFQKEKLKPKLKLNYNQLINQNKYTDLVALENQTLGASFSFPLFLRTERGKLKETQYKIENLQYEIDNKKIEITNKLKNNQNNHTNLSKQLTLLDNNTRIMETLFEAELTKLSLGESSLFLVNKRQEMLLEMELKKIDCMYELTINNLEFLLLNNQLVPSNVLEP